MAITLKAVIFDYGNVLCEPQAVADIQAMADILVLPLAEFQQHYWRNRIAYDAAELDPIQYWERIAMSAGRALSIDDIEKLRHYDVVGWSRPRPVMVEWARRLRDRGVRTAVLSNMPLDLRRSLTGSDRWLPDFDHMTFSCDVHLTKPGAAIYEHCLHGLGIRAEETLFLDDRPENVGAAQRLGIHSLEFTSACAAASVLESQFELPVEIEC